ncbi:MAG: methyltransferase domain-containing protein [Pseudomonadota bacterium]
MTKDVMKPQLWTERSPEASRQVYTDWADSYDRDLAQKEYQTPDRIAQALAAHIPQDDRPVLDFGCGTGLSGAALQAVGLKDIHGTDITQAMLDRAAPKGIYSALWHGEPGMLDVAPGTYRAIVATGVVSFGAAPPETMDLLIDALARGDMLALSFNDPTLEHGGYDAHLQTHLDDGRAAQVFRDHGVHLRDMGMGSDVIVLKRL